MSAKKPSETKAGRGSDVEGRFNHLLAVMKDRYLATGYELDDVHLAKILGVHDGVLRKGKTSSVSPALATAAGRTWQVDLNWLLLGDGEQPDASGAPAGIDKLDPETRISRGRWDEHKVRRLLAEKNLNQRELSRQLGTDPQRAGNLVRGTLRDAALRKRLAEILEVKPDALFLVARAYLQRLAAGGEQSRRRYSAAEIRRALAEVIERHLEPVLAGESASTGELTYEPTDVVLDIPPPPARLSEELRLRYIHNRETLERWSATPAAFPVPRDVAGRYCREVVGFYDGGRLDDVGGILRDFIQEGSLPSDNGMEQLPEIVELKRGVLMIAGREIEVDDPALLAKLPEYLASEAGKRRLLAWLKSNVDNPRQR
jgi:transcriptional regulator with XRE-family HTH domain